MEKILRTSLWKYPSRQLLLKNLSYINRRLILDYLMRSAECEIKRVVDLPENLYVESTIAFCHPYEDKKPLPKEQPESVRS